MATTTSTLAQVIEKEAEKLLKLSKDENQPLSGENIEKLERLARATRALRAPAGKDDPADDAGEKEPTKEELLKAAES